MLDSSEALRLLPDGLELAEPATASLVIAKYHFSTFGPYNEAILGVGCKWKGELMSFLPNLFVTQEAPLIAGREIWGYAKKLADVDLVKEHEQYMGTIERPRGSLERAGLARVQHADRRRSLASPLGEGDRLVSLWLVQRLSAVRQGADRVLNL